MVQHVGEFSPDVISYTTLMGSWEKSQICGRGEEFD
jgi:hypothetical protein